MILLRIIGLVGIWIGGLGWLQAIPNLDSLQAVYDQQVADTLHIDLGYDLSDWVADGDPQQALAYLEASIALSRQLQDERRLCRGLLNLCQFRWYREGNPSAAKALLPDIQALLSRFESPAFEISYGMQAASVFYLLGEYDSAVTYYLIANEGFVAKGDSLGLAKCANNIGNVYCNLYQWEEAMTYFRKAEQILISLSDTAEHSGLAYTWGNIALVYGNTGELAQALTYYQKSKAVDERYGQKGGIAMNLQNIGDVYEKQGKYIAAEQSITASLALFTELQDQAGMLYANHALGKIAGKQGHYREGLAYLRAAWQQAHALELLDEVQRIAISFSELFANQGAYDSALHYRVVYEGWKDSLVQLSHLNRIKDLEIQYETKDKEKQIELLTQQNRIQELENAQRTNWLLALIGGLVLMSLVIGLRLYYSQQKLRIERELAAQQEALQAAQIQHRISELEMKALRAQMNPHFVFNCLNSINLLVLEGQAERASRYLVRFSKLLRKILEHAEIQLVPLDDELSMIQDYIELETLRFKEKINYQIAVAPELDPEILGIPAMTLQPLVENAIWHGLMHKEAGGHILIAVERVKADLLRCTVEDNGIGRQKAAELGQQSPLKQQSFGLQITRERLHLVQNENLRGKLEIEDLDVGRDGHTGTRVQVFIPWIEL